MSEALLEAVLSERDPSDVFIISTLRDDARGLVESIVECMTKGGHRCLADMILHIKTVDALNEVLRYYGGETVGVPDWVETRQ